MCFGPKLGLKVSISAMYQPQGHSEMAGPRLTALQWLLKIAEARHSSDIQLNNPKKKRRKIDPVSVFLIPVDKSLNYIKQLRRKGTLCGLSVCNS